MIEALLIIGIIIWLIFSKDPPKVSLEEQKEDERLSQRAIMGHVWDDPDDPTSDCFKSYHPELYANEEIEQKLKQN